MRLDSGNDRKLKPLAPLDIRTPQTGDKSQRPEKKQTVDQRPRPVPDVPLSNKKTNNPARSDYPDASANLNHVSPSDFQRGQEM